MRLIDADEIIKWADDSVSQYGQTYSTDMLNMFGLFKHIINKAPTIVPSLNLDNLTEEKLEQFKNMGLLAINEERPQAEWKLHGMIWYCSNCGKDCEQGGNNYCGQCGARMKGGTE